MQSSVFDQRHTSVCARDALCVSSTNSENVRGAPWRGTTVAVNLPMHKYLKAWRDHRNMTQEHVANKLNVTHTTVGRWERGDVKLSVKRLQELSELYHASVTQLQMPPEVEELVGLLDRAQSIIAKLDPADRERWIGIGESLSERPKPK
jgi:transcriptional regulator with XRE-family HTH domain